MKQFHELLMSFFFNLVYVSIGADDSDSADIKVVTDGTKAAGETRKWEIKVSQIPCFSDYS